MIKPFTKYEKYRGERSPHLAAACDITRFGISEVLYDKALSRRFARTVFWGEELTAGSIIPQLSRIVSSSLRQYGVSAAEVEDIGFAAPVYLTGILEELSPDSLFLSPDVNMAVLPFVSAEIGGRFTACLAAAPLEEGTLIADFGGTLCAAVFAGGALTCASAGLKGAFDGSAIESGMTGETGAADSVSREMDGTLCYSVAGDGDSMGLSPAAVLNAAVLMRGEGIIDEDGIMTDRDLFYIGEDFYISQSDIRAVQSDKALAGATLSLLLNKTGEPWHAYLSGEPLAGDGLRSLVRLGVVPEKLAAIAGFCRNSAEQGIINCLCDRALYERVCALAYSAEDITAELSDRRDELYFDRLAF